MQTFQMAILLLFEKTDSLTCKEVQETLQLNSEQFGKHLTSLIESKILLADTEVINVLLLFHCITASHRSYFILSYFILFKCFTALNGKIIFAVLANTQLTVFKMEYFA